jgi:hypothetical protein
MVRPDGSLEKVPATEKFAVVRGRLHIYAEMAKWPVLLVWWGAALVNGATVLGARLGLPWRDGACQSPYCDLSAFWQTARMAAVGHAAQAYDPATFLAIRAALFGRGADDLFWFYPPPAMLAIAGLAGLPLSGAFWVWTIALGGLAVLLLRAADLRAAVIAAGLLSPAALWNAQLGQFGVLTGAALVAALAAARALPAGLALGLLVIKPQAGLLAPVALLVAGHWRALLAAVLTAAVLVAGSDVLLGPAVWWAYLGPGLSLSQAMLVRLSVTPGTAQFAVSVFGMLRSAGASVGVAGGMQVLATLSALAGAAWVWRRRGGRRVLCTTILALLATPYGYVDDMVGVSLALAMVVQARGWRFSLTDALLFTWPVLGPVVYGGIGLQLTPVLLCLALWRSGAGSRPETAPGSADRPADAPAAGRT